MPKKRHLVKFCCQQNISCWLWLLNINPITWLSWTSTVMLAKTEPPRTICILPWEGMALAAESIFYLVVVVEGGGGDAHIQIPLVCECLHLHWMMPHPTCSWTNEEMSIYYPDCRNLPLVSLAPSLSWWPQSCSWTSTAPSTPVQNLQSPQYPWTPDQQTQSWTAAALFHLK